MGSNHRGHDRARQSGDDVGSPTPGPEMLVDGSFESAGVRNNSWSHFSSVGGWKSDTGVEVWGKNFYGLQGTDGNNFAELDFDRRASSIYQDVQTEAGAEYTFSFDYMKRPDNAAGSDTIQVYWNGEFVGTVDPTKSAWENASFKVKGTGGSDRIEFREAGSDNDSYGGLIDNASLRMTAPAPVVDQESDEHHSGDDHHDGRGHGDGDHNDDGHSDNGQGSHGDNHHDGDRDDHDDEDDGDGDGEGDDQQVTDEGPSGKDSGQENGDHDDSDASEGDGSEEDGGEEVTPPVTPTLVLNVADVGEILTHETMQGGTDDDSFVGGAGNDKLYGDKGDDNLVGDDTGLMRSPLSISTTLSGGVDPMAISYLVSGMPADAMLSAGTRNADGTWSLSATDVQGLEITFTDAAGFTLHVVVTSTDGSELQAEADIQVSLQSGQSDHLEGGGGNDNINGDAGNDVIYGGSAPTGLSTPHVDAPEDNDVVSGGAGNDMIWGNSGDDQINGDEGDDTVFGGKGNDVINGGEGNDTINGNTGDDLILGDAGDDVLKGNAGNDHLSDGEGSDTVEGSSGDDLVAAGEGDDSYNGGSGYDTIDFSNATAGMAIDLSKKQAVGMGTDKVWNFEAVVGSSHDDMMKGSKSGEALSGGDGNDVLRGLGGSDALSGGEGDDTFVWLRKDVVDDAGKHLGVDTVLDLGQGDHLDLSEMTKGDGSLLNVRDGEHGATIQVSVGGAFVDVVTVADWTANDLLASGIILT